MSCRQDPNLDLSPCRRVMIFLAGALECLLFGGAVFGWPQLVHLLKMESVYADLCSDVNTAAGEGINQYKAVPYGELFNNSRCVALNVTPVFLPGHKVGVEQCAPQDDRFALIFTIAVCCYGIPSFLVGYLLHHAGLWAARISAGVMLCVGFIFLGITTKEHPDWLFPSIILLSLGGNQIRMSGLQLADLFPAHKATALTLLTGMFAASASLFLVLQLAERYHIERSIICWCLAASATFIIWATFIMPVHHIPYDDNYDQNQGTESSEELERLQESQLVDHWISKPNSFDRLAGTGITGGTDRRKKPPRDDIDAALDNAVKVKEFEDLSLVGATFSVSSILLQVWLCTSLLAMNVYQMTYNYWITIVSCTTKEAETFSVVYSYVNFVSIFIAPLFGLFVDCLVSRARRMGRSYRERRAKEIQANIVPMLITTLCTLAMYACLLFFRPVGVFLSLAFMTIARPCIVSVSTAYMRIRFPVEHFNRLVGIHFTLASMILLLQYPQFQWSQNMYMAAHGTVLLLLAFSLLNPLHLVVRPLFINSMGSPRQASGGALSEGD